jgi:hypothetical protein
VLGAPHSFVNNMWVRLHDILDNMRMRNAHLPYIYEFDILVLGVYKFLMKLFLMSLTQSIEPSSLSMVTIKD